MTHICVGNLINLESDNGLSPGRHQAIIWTNAGLLLIGPLGRNFNEILIAILTFSFKKMRLEVSSVKRRPFCLGLNLLRLSDTPQTSPSRASYGVPIIGNLGKLDCVEKGPQCTCSKITCTSHVSASSKDDITQAVSYHASLLTLWEHFSRSINICLHLNHSLMLM